MPFEYRDADGYGVTVEPTPTRTGPGLSFEVNVGTGFEVPLDRVEEFVAGIRDAARQASGQQPDATHSCSNCDGIDPDTCLTNPERAAADPDPTDTQPTVDRAAVLREAADAFRADAAETARTARKSYDPDMARVAKQLHAVAARLDHMADEETPR